MTETSALAKRNSFIILTYTCVFIKFESLNTKKVIGFRWKIGRKEPVNAKVVILRINMPTAPELSS
jgi:hypothetical protein